MASYYDNDSEQQGNPIIEWIVDFLDDHKKQFIKLGIVAFLVIAVSLTVYIIDNTWTKNDQIGYECVLYLRDHVDNPETFRLHTQIFMVKKLTESGDVECVYTVFRYSVKDDDGRTKSDQAIFKDGRYMIDYTATADPNDPNYEEITSARKDLVSYDFKGDGKSFRTINLKLEMIQEKLGQEP